MNSLSQVQIACDFVGSLHTHFPGHKIRIFWLQFGPTLKEKKWRPFKFINLKNGGHFIFNLIFCRLVILISESGSVVILYIAYRHLPAG